MVPQLLQLREPGVRVGEPPAKLGLTLRGVRVVLVLVVSQASALLLVRLGGSFAGGCVVLAVGRVRDVRSTSRLGVSAGIKRPVLAHGADVPPPRVRLPRRRFRVWIEILSTSVDLRDASLVSAGRLRGLLDARRAETFALGGVELVRRAFQRVRRRAPRANLLPEMVELVLVVLRVGMSPHRLEPSFLQLHDLVEADGVTNGDDAVVVDLAPPPRGLGVGGLAPRGMDLLPRDPDGTLAHAPIAGLLADARVRDGGGGGSRGEKDERREQTRSRAEPKRRRHRARASWQWDRGSIERQRYFQSARPVPHRPA